VDENDNGGRTAKLNPGSARARVRPVTELSPTTAAAREVADGDWLAISALHGRVRARAKLNAHLTEGVLAAPHS
jgi:anaerobic selenocysteine-containing dehydrogenase